MADGINYYYILNFNQDVDRQKLMDKVKTLMTCLVELEMIQKFDVTINY